MSVLNINPDTYFVNRYPTHDFESGKAQIALHVQRSLFGQVTGIPDVNGSIQASVLIELKTGRRRSFDGPRKIGGAN
jgi:hypothetical protein